MTSRSSLQSNWCASPGSNFPPAADEFGHPAVVTVEPQSLDFGMQLQRRAPIPHRSPRIGFQHLDQPIGVRRHLGVAALPPVARLNAFRRLQPLPDGLPGQPRPPFNLRQAQPVTVMQPPYFPQQIHGDHLLQFPARSRAGELNTLGNFQRADPSFPGYFSVRVNRPLLQCFQFPARHGPRPRHSRPPWRRPEACAFP